MIIRDCYDGDQVIVEYFANDTLMAQNVYGPGIDEPICRMYQGVYAYGLFYYFDGLGSVAAVAYSSGGIYERYEYDVYGKCIVHTSAGEDEEWMTADDDVQDYSVCNPFLFTGRQLDSETGLYYYRARHYHPEIGRFMQTDPIGYDDSMNLYAYCLNDPINWIDPMGDRRYRNRGTGKIVPGSIEEHHDHSHGGMKTHYQWQEEHTDPATGKSRTMRRSGPRAPDPSTPSIPIPSTPPPGLFRLPLNFFFPIPLFFPPWCNPWFNPGAGYRPVASLPTRCTI